MKLIIRKLEKKDYKPYKKLFEETYYEYLENLRHSNPQQYRIEMKDQRKVTSSRFNFYVQTGNSFIAERDGIVVSYIAAQTIPYMRGHDKSSGSNTSSLRKNIDGKE
jgi:hypothetical protein